MGETQIRWTDQTWNPVTGCSKVSPGCAHCYAETLALTRLAGKPGYPGLPWTPENAEANVSIRPARLLDPLAWSTPARVFVNSMSDLFHDLVPAPFIASAFAVMALSPQHTYQILTKRPERMAALVGAHDFAMSVLATAGDIRRESSPARRRKMPSPLDLIPWPLPNVWLGTSVELQLWGDRRIPHLLAAPAEVHFLSCEPLLGPLDLTPYLDDLDWIIVGGESGPIHRVMEDDWARAIRDDTTAAGAAFFFKQHSGRFTEQGKDLDGQRWEQYPDSPEGIARRRGRRSLRPVPARGPVPQAPPPAGPDGLGL
jgi:protein gp37